MNPKPKSIHAQYLGRLGGRAGRGACKARSSEQARRAVMVRWEKHDRLEVGWSYPSSPNATKFGFGSVGCWTVSRHVGTNPPIELAGFTDKAEAEAYKDALLSEAQEPQPHPTGDVIPGSS